VPAFSIAHLQDDADGRAGRLGEIGLGLVFRGEQLDEVLGVAKQVVGLVADGGMKPARRGDAIADPRRRRRSIPDTAGR